MQPFSLSTPASELRPLAPSDVDAVLAGCQDPEVLHWTAALPEPYTRADAEEFVGVIAPGGWADDTAYTWAVTAPHAPGAGELLGVIGLSDPLSGRPEIGYWLAPAARGRGLMVQSVEAVCRYGFEQLGAVAVLWRAFEGNEASRRVAERVGFRIGEPVRHLLAQRGTWREAWLGMLEPGAQPVGEQAELSDGVVRLRRWELTDLPVLHTLVDPAVLQWTTFPGPDPERMREWIAVNRRVRRAPDARFAIADAAGTAVGSLRLNFDAYTGAASLGWWLGPGARGRGYARRALELALPWAARHGAVRFVAEIYAGNFDSVALAERLGLQYEGVRRAHWPAREPGTPRRDTWLYGLVPGDAAWPSAAAGSGAGRS